MSSIPLLNLPRQTAPIRREIDAAIARVIDHGQFILGPEVRQFEERFAALCNTRFAVACASGSDALLLPLMALGIEPGDRVIVPAFTFFATAGSVAHLGAAPIFLDIDPKSFNLDPAALEAFLAACPAGELRRIKAIIPVHLFGQCADMAAILATAARYGIPVIEDAAQAVGAAYRGSSAGSLGWCGTFSFFPSKNLGGFGDGGMIVTNDSALAAKLQILRVHGAAETYRHRFVGINSRLDTLQAAVLLVKLNHLEEWTRARRANARAYRTFFDRTPGLPILIPEEISGLEHVWNQYTVRVPDRDSVRARLAEEGISTAIYYPVPLHLQECFAALGYKPGDLPHSESAAREVLSLPIDHSLSSDEVETVARSLVDSVTA